MTFSSNITPRRPGEPEPDLTTFSLIHRAMRGDVRRLADTTAGLAATAAALPADRVSAIAAYLEQLCDEIHQHHSREDDLLWPVIAAAAGAAVDLAPLTDDHTVLSPVLDRVQAAARALPADPGRVIGELAGGLARMRDLLDEHIPEEERDVFPVIRRYISAADWQGLERRMAKGLSFAHMWWLAPVSSRESCGP